MSIIDASAPHSVRSDYSTFAVGDVNGHDTGMHRSIIIERPPFTYSDRGHGAAAGCRGPFPPPSRRRSGRRPWGGRHAFLLSHEQGAVGTAHRVSALNGCPLDSGETPAGCGSQRCRRSTGARQHPVLQQISVTNGFTRSCAISLAAQPGQPMEPRRQTPRTSRRKWLDTRRSPDGRRHG
jgi:hypothetical protein